MTYRRDDKCPRCRGPLVLEEHAGLSVHRCPERDGWFVETNDLSRVRSLESLDRESIPSAIDDSPFVNCPVCQQAMSRIFVVPASVHVDICDGHGIWLDRGELGRLVLHDVEHDEAPAPRDAELAPMSQRLADLLSRLFGSGDPSQRE